MIRLLAAVLLAGTALPASAQMKPAKPEAVAEAVADCWAALGAMGVDGAVLARSGWKAGSIQDRKGARIDTPLQVYGKANSEVMLMLMPTGSTTGCSVVSRLGSASDVSLTAQAVQRRLTAADPKVGTARSGRSIAFLALPKIAVLDATGTKAQPSVRVVVGFQVPEKK